MERKVQNTIYTNNIISIIMLSPLKCKQKWRRIRSINYKYIEGYIFIIKKYKKSYLF
jgi:hypothetical protein